MRGEQLVMMGLGGALALACVAAKAAPTLGDCDGPHAVTLHSAAAVEARAYWLNRRLIKWPGADSEGIFKLYYSAGARIRATPGGRVSGADGALVLSRHDAAIPAAEAQRFKFVGDGPVLAVASADADADADAGADADAAPSRLLTRQLLIVREADDGTVRDATALQIAGALDDIYASAASVDDLGVSVGAREAGFKLWAPTAQNVALCTYASGTGRAAALTPMTRDDATGIWSAHTSLATGRTGHTARTASTGRTARTAQYYRYLVDVVAPSAGLVRNLVTDPYSLSLTTDSKRSYIADLDAADLKPAGWATTPTPDRVAEQTDMTVYELHVRDFSINDSSVSAAHRGKYAAFTEAGSNGMRHLAALSKAGMTDIHLLPVYDIGSVPERGCVTPHITATRPDGAAQQAAVEKTKFSDCYNWGYDPLHYSAPEGSYSTDPSDGARRIIEFRQMVQALHQTGLRVGMDVVYNHTYRAGQHQQSVLDRVVPGYYHRLDARGAIEHSTCCDNTATENLMMGKLMIDSVALWARHYKIDSFRFDLMGHQPRAVMEQLQARVNQAAGRRVNLIGEGWNFGEVADGARFVQASQLSLNGSGIGTFSDRARDAVRGGGAGDSGVQLIARQGYINGLVYAPNQQAGQRPPADLLQAADMVKAGLAGTIRSYPLPTADGRTVALQDLVYGGNQPAGYASEPGETVNYVENHDNQTLYDINAFKLPQATSARERAQVQMLGAAINAFSQGVAYFHAGFDILRSKSLDRNSFESGDWFNRLDWRYQDNHYGSGLPPAADNGKDYALLRPLLRNAAIKPAPADIAYARDAFRDLLAIRASSTLFRLRSADDIVQRLRFFNTGPSQVPTVIAAHLDGRGYPGARFQSITYLINVDKVARRITVAEEKNRRYVLHPVHTSDSAADRRVARRASYERASGSYTLPPRSVAVFVETD